MVVTRHLALTLSFLALVGTACDDGAGDSAFDVIVEPDRSEGNAPFTVTFDARIASLSELAFAWDFGDGETSDVDDPTHTFTEPGDYTVTVDVTDDAGNSGSAEVAITVHGAADLEASDVAVAPRRTRAGAEIDVAFGFRNLGEAVIGEWELLVFLNPERSLDGATTLKTESRTDEFGGDAPQSVQETITLPAELPSGDYYVGVAADPAGLVGDSNRDNNLAFAPFVIEVRNPTDNGPDLTPCGLDVPAFTAVGQSDTPLARVGEQLQVEVCFANTGNRPAPQGGYAVFLSTDEVFDPDDLEVARRDGVALGPDDRESFSDSVDLPLDVDPGTYHLLVVADVDDAVEEQREDNNTRLYPRAFRLAGLEPVDGIDLLVASVDVSGDRIYWTQQVSGTLTLRNLGNAPVERNFVVRVLAAPTNGDEPVLLSSINRSGIGAEAEEMLEIRATLSRRVEPGDYRVMACADPTNSTDDVNRGNNCRTLQRVLNLGGDPDFDLAVDGTGFAPPEVDAGDMITVTATVSNPGADPTGPFDAALVLSPTGRFDDAVVLQRFPVESIAGDEAAELEQSVPVPLDLDQQVAGWRVGVVADPDNALRGERDEENNVDFAPGELTVRGAMGGCSEDAREDNDRFEDAAELPPGTHEGLGACDDADWFEIGVPAGQVLDVTASWDDADGTIVVDLADEAGAVVRGAEALPGAASLFVAPAAEVRTVLLRVTGAGARLQYDLTVAFSEAGDAARLRARGVTVSPPVTEAGASVELVFELVNVGGAASAGGDLEVSLNAAPTPDGADRVGAIAADGVPAGGSAEVRGRIDLPDGLADGRYYALVDAGDGVGVGALRIDAEQACDPDAFEPNISPHEPGDFEGVAAPLEAGEYADLRACVGDDDWYAIELNEGERLDVEVEFDARQGDLDAVLYAPDGTTELVRSAGLQSIERLPLPRAQETGAHFVRVYTTDQVNIENTYSMRVVIDEDGGCEDDAFEPNGDARNAAVLPAERNDLVLCPGDVDFFAFNIPAGNVVRFTANAAAGALELTLFDPDGAVVGNGPRNIPYQAEQNGVHTLRVATLGAVVVPYQLEVVGVSGVDVCLQSLALSRDSAAPGDAFRADVTLCQLRNLPVRDVPVSFLWSVDETPSADDTTLGELVVPLVPGAGEADATRRLRVPRGADPGAGFVVAVVDPEARVADLNRRNNTGSVAFEINAACIDDDFRTNEGPLTATPLEGPSPHEGGVICPHTQDWYALQVDDAGEVTVSIEFDNAAGDLDLALWRMADGVPEFIDASETDRDIEALTLEVPAGALLIQVTGFDDAAAPYRLSWTLP